MTEPVTAYTASRRDFLGRNGTPEAPVALRPEGELGGITGAGIDPCAALQCVVDLEPGETREIAILLGACDSEASARKALADYKDLERAKSSIERTVEQWDQRLSVVTVKTPEPTFDAMINRWTLYQALACRMWARSAFYQSSGAYGFRDQLQDVMAFVYAEPAMARAQILRAAARQFVEGDVQHWWHPQSGRGVRTRFSDDLAWLPYVVDHYVARHRRRHGARGVRAVPHACARSSPDEHEIYDLPEVTERARRRVYEHCLRALRKACTTGAHGLPLIGSGDWNDGMNRVGVEGRGESVWLAWFLITTLRAFAEQVRRARRHGRRARRSARRPTRTRRRSRSTDGTASGTAAPTSTTARRSASRRATSAASTAIAQSWSVISGAGDPARQADQAMRSLEEHLVRRGRAPARAAHAAVRPDRARPRLHQGLPARRARERRAVHARRALGGAGHRPAGRRATAPSSCSR